MRRSLLQYVILSPFTEIQGSPVLRYIGPRTVIIRVNNRKDKRILLFFSVWLRVRWPNGSRILLDNTCFLWLWSTLQLHIALYTSLRSPIKRVPQENLVTNLPLYALSISPFFFVLKNREYRTEQKYVWIILPIVFFDNKVRIYLESVHYIVS